MEEFIRQLGIQGVLVPSTNDSLVLTIEGPDNYGRVFSRLDKSDLVYEDEESSQLTEHSSSIQYDSDKYRITLLANFDTDDYRLVIKEN